VVVTKMIAASRRGALNGHEAGKKGMLVSRCVWMSIDAAAGIAMIRAAARGQREIVLWRV
jgi:hypothetical protein